MSLKNFMSYEDATTVLGEYADKVNELKSGLINLDVALSVPDGAGKNLIPLTVDGIKALNTTGTWSGNAYTSYGVTYTVQTDSNGNVIGISANGTVPTDIWASAFILPGVSVKDGESYTLTGCPDGGSTNSYTLYTTNDGDTNKQDFGNGITYTAYFTGNAYVRIAIYRGITVNDIVFTPMIRQATITDPTFAPYIPSVESRIEAVESAIKVSRVTVSPDANGYVNLSPSGFTKAGFKYVNAVVTGESSARSYDVRVWLSDNYGWVASIYTVDTFTKVTDTSVSLDLVVFGVAV